MLEHPGPGISCGARLSRRDLLAATAAVVAAPGIASGAPGRVPAGTIRFIVPFAPGGSVDVLGRAVAKAVGEALGQQTLVENVAGG